MTSAAPAQEATHTGDSRIVGDSPRRSGVPLCIMPHGAELQAEERRPQTPQTLLSEKHWPRRLQFYCERNRGEERQLGYKRQPSEENVDQSLCARLRLCRGQRPKQVIHYPGAWRRSRTPLRRRQEFRKRANRDALERQFDRSKGCVASYQIPALADHQHIGITCGDEFVQARENARVGFTFQASIGARIRFSKWFCYSPGTYRCR